MNNNIEELNFPKASQLDEEFKHERLIKALKRIKVGLFEALEKESTISRFEITSKEVENEFGSIPEDLLDDIIFFLTKYEYKCKISNEKILFTDVKFLYVYYNK